MLTDRGKRKVQVVKGGGCIPFEPSPSYPTGDAQVSIWICGSEAEEEELDKRHRFEECAKLAGKSAQRIKRIQRLCGH